MLIILPIARFARKMHGRFNFLAIVALAAATLWCLPTHPDTQTAPIKVHFLQRVLLGKQLDPPPAEQASSSELTARTRTRLSPLRSSAFTNTHRTLFPNSYLLMATKDGVKEPRPGSPTVRGLSVTYPPFPGDGASSGWVTYDIERVEGKTLRTTIRVRGTNARW